MEGISLVPQTQLNSIFENNGKACSNGNIILENRIVNYFMSVDDTTSIVIDTSLLTGDYSNYNLTFNLKVISTRDNVLNFTGCDVEQINVKQGVTEFIFSKPSGFTYWHVEFKVVSLESQNKLISDGNTQSNCWSDYFMENMQRGSSGAFFYSGDKPWITFYENPATFYLNFNRPRMLTSIEIGTWYYPNGLQYAFDSITIYGSNDKNTWTLLTTANDLVWTQYSQSINLDIPTANQMYFRNFKFVISKSNSDRVSIGAAVMYGYTSEHINCKKWQMAFPTINADSSGFSIAFDSNTAIQDRSIYYTTNPNYDSNVIIKRTDTTKPFGVIYTCPEPVVVKMCSLNTYNQDNTKIEWFELLGSNDGETWTTICKQRNVWENDFIYYFGCTGTTAYSQYLFKIILAGSNVTYATFRSFNLWSETGMINDFVSLVPKLSANSQDGYVVSATNTDDGQYYQMFDGNPDTYCAGHFDNGEWITTLQLPIATAFNCLRIKARPSYQNQTPSSFTIQASNDNSTWTILKSVVLGTSYWTTGGQEESFSWENNTAYLYYRIVSTLSLDGYYCGMAEQAWGYDEVMQSIDWYEDVYVVPVMSADSQDGYVASATSSYDSSYAPYKAFTRNSSDCWVCGNDDQTDGNKECDVYLQIQLPTATAINVLNIVARSGLTDQSPSSFTLEASNDGSDWTTLLTVTDKDTYDSATWEVSNTTAYLYYKLAITKTNRASSHVSVSGFNLIQRIIHN